jgi:hypothetical protein
MFTNSSAIRLLAAIFATLSLASWTAEADSIIFTTTATGVQGDVILPILSDPSSKPGYMMTLMSSSSPEEIGTNPTTITIATQDVTVNSMVTGTQDIHATLDVTVTDVTTNEQGTFTIMEDSLGEFSGPVPPMSPPGSKGIILTNVVFSIIPSGNILLLQGFEFPSVPSTTLTPEMLPFSTTNKFDLHFALIPEPGSLTLMLLGIGGVGLLTTARSHRGRSRETGIRLDP